MSQNIKSLTILTLNSNSKLSAMINKVAKDLGTNIISKRTGEILNSVSEENPTIVLLDCNKNFNERLSLCKKIREKVEVPIVFIADFSDVYTRVKAFESGCDDFISGGFNSKELTLRLSSIIRRYYRDLNNKNANDCIFINRDRNEVSIGSIFLELTQAEYRLLLLLSSRPDKFLTREELCQVLGKEGGVATRTVDSHVKNLRLKLSKFCPDTKFIRTKYGVGYAWEFKSTQIL